MIWRPKDPLVTMVFIMGAENGTENGIENADVDLVLE